MILLTEDPGDAVHEIRAQSQSKRLIVAGEEGTSPRNIDRKDVSFLELSQGGFGTKSCGKPHVRSGSMVQLPDYAEAFLAFEDVRRVEHDLRK